MNDTLDWQRIRHLLKIGILASLMVLTGDMLLGWGVSDPSVTNLPAVFTRYLSVSDGRIVVSALLAYNYGARDSARLRESLQKTALLTAGFGFLSAAGCWLGREHLLALFLKDAANLALGSRFLFWLILASPFLGFFYLSSNFLQAAGKAFQATLVSVLRQGVLLIPALYLMHDFFGLTGIAAAHTAADFGAILAASVLGLRGYRQIAAADNLVNTSWKCDSF
ncbi:MAG: hypothetical protein II873_04245 [Oscillospiraceae bacterium]|nr:hypothetical protein [Oscillospiraceae bacterium]